jgi:hypothetical protein
MQVISIQSFTSNRSHKWIEFELLGGFGEFGKSLAKTPQ